MPGFCVTLGQNQTRLRRNTIRFIVVLATLSIVGLVIVQVYWVSNAYDLEEKKLDQGIYIALQRVAEQIAAYNRSTLPTEQVVNQVSSDYFIVNVNDVIDVNLLEHYLKQEFSARNIALDFEYGIYNCNTDRMVYGRYVGTAGLPDLGRASRELPKYDRFIYYFGVQFPTKASHLVANLGIWIFSSVIMLVVIGFFGYALFVILAQKRLAEVQKDFIDNMTHEFQTPIATIAISAEVLLQPDIAQQPERLRTYANIVRTEGLRLKNQVERVLQIARFERLSAQLELEVVDLHAVIGEVVQIFALKAQGDRPTAPPPVVVTDLQAQPATVQADKVHLVNMLLNLLDNAAKYTEQGPRITVQTRTEAGGLRLSVADNGIGIPKKFQEKIFAKFFRVPTGNVHKVKGFGLGLHYVRQLAKAHGWKLHVDSQEGQGSVFSFWLPRG
jgi:two-component system, OmpR family, phosphate regulon sensor histidine kinase PhoR